MFTQKEAKTMARFLRDALGNRNVLLSHSDCLEIVARQFGLADWNTLAAKIHRDDERDARSQSPTAALPASPATASNTQSGSVAAIASQDAKRPTKTDEAEATKSAEPWTTCSFCGKSRPEVRIVLGGCGGWEGFRARRNPEGGERSNVFICHECVDLSGRIVADARTHANKAETARDTSVS